MLYKLMDACREAGCPVCRVEQQSVERYLENQFYENVNSPKWRDRLRHSLGFCHEHAWLAVDRRLGDPLGFSIIYRDLLNSILKRLEEGSHPVRSARHWASLLRKIPEQARSSMENLLYAITPSKRCPICEHRDETCHMILSILMDAMDDPQMAEALKSSDGICLPHLQQSLEVVKNAAACETLIQIHREKLENLRGELDEFIRKNDYQVQENFGSEGDAWMRAVALVVGRKRGK